MQLVIPSLINDFPKGSVAKQDKNKLINLQTKSIFLEKQIRKSNISKR